MRALLVAITAAAALGGVWLWSRGPATPGSRARPSAAAPHAAPDAAPAGGAPPGAAAAPAAAGRDAISSGESFDALMRAKYGERTREEMERAYWTLHRDVRNAAMRIGQPAVQDPAAPLYDGRRPPPEVVLHVGPGLDGRLRTHVVSESEHPEVYRERREEIWLRRELDAE